MLVYSRIFQVPKEAEPFLRTWEDMLFAKRDDLRPVINNQDHGYLGHFRAREILQAFARRVEIDVADGSTAFADKSNAVIIAIRADFSTYKAVGK